MAKITVSNDIDGFIQSTDNAAARTAIGLGTGDDVEYTNLTASGTVKASAHQTSAGFRIAFAGDILFLDSSNAATYDGKIIDFTAASSTAVVLYDSIPTDFNCGMVQEGAGQVTFAGAGGLAINSYLSLKSTAGQYAGVTLYKKGAGVMWLGGTLG